MAQDENKDADPGVPPGNTPIGQVSQPVGIASVNQPGEPGVGGSPVASNPHVPDAEEAEAAIDDLDEPRGSGPSRAPVRPEVPYEGSAAERPTPEEAATGTGPTPGNLVGGRDAQAGESGVQPAAREKSAAEQDAPKAKAAADKPARK